MSQDSSKNLQLYSSFCFKDPPLHNISNTLSFLPQPQVSEGLNPTAPPLNNIRAAQVQLVEQSMGSLSSGLPGVTWKAGLQQDSAALAIPTRNLLGHYSSYGFWQRRATAQERDVQGFADCHLLQRETLKTAQLLLQILSRCSTKEKKSPASREMCLPLSPKLAHSSY